MTNGGESLNQLVTLILLNGVQVSNIRFQYVDSVVEVEDEVNLWPTVSRPDPWPIFLSL
jgi:hypothetical protein